jgi:hypothetical protein
VDLNVEIWSWRDDATCEYHNVADFDVKHEGVVHYERFAPVEVHETLGVEQHRSGGGCFDAILVNTDERLLDDVADVNLALFARKPAEIGPREGFLHPQLQQTCHTNLNVQYHLHSLRSS